MMIDQIIEQVRRLATEYPDTVYPQPEPGKCLYTVGACGSGSGCIVGQAIIAVKPDLAETLAHIDELTPNKPVHSLVGRLEIKCTQEKLSWLGKVQRKQDDGKRWHEAVEAADEEYPLT